MFHRQSTTLYGMWQGQCLRCVSVVHLIWQITQTQTTNGTYYGQMAQFKLTSSIEWSHTSELITFPACMPLRARIILPETSRVCRIYFRKNISFSLRRGCCLLNLVNSRSSLVTRQRSVVNQIERHSSQSQKRPPKAVVSSWPETSKTSIHTNTMSFKGTFTSRS